MLIGYQGILPRQRGNQVHGIRLTSVLSAQILGLRLAQHGRKEGEFMPANARKLTDQELEAQRLEWLSKETVKILRGLLRDLGRESAMAPVKNLQKQFPTQMR